MKSIVMSAPAPTAAPRWRLGFEVAALPGERRLVLSLFYHEGLSLPQIGQVLKKSEDEVAAEFYLAHANLGMAPLLESLVDARQMSGTH